MHEFLSKEDFAASLQEANENHLDNELHALLQHTEYTLGVYHHIEGGRRYALSHWNDLTNPVLTSRSREEVLTYIKTKILTS